MKKQLKHLFKKPTQALARARGREVVTPEDEGTSLGGIPRITNETVAQHREEVLRGARKFIYPLQHSKHRIVMISSVIALVSVLSFFSFCVLQLYKFQTTSEFMYRITRVIPFPVARVSGDFVPYESYLFELRHYMHYYTTQQQVDFSTDSGKQQLAQAKKQALQKAVDNAYVSRIAKEKGVAVTDQEVNQRITTLRDNSRLGNSTKVYLDVLKDFYDWSEADFKRSIRDQLLVQKLLPQLDKDTLQRAEKALAELAAGKPFGEVAKAYSDDTATKDTGGDIGIVDRASRDLSAQTVEALFKLTAGQTSGLVDIGYGVEIVKNLEPSGDKIHAAHILFNYKDISNFLNDRKAAEAARLYLKID